MRGDLDNDELIGSSLTKRSGPSCPSLKDLAAGLLDKLIRLALPVVFGRGQTPFEGPLGS